MSGAGGRKGTPLKSTTGKSPGPGTSGKKPVSRRPVEEAKAAVPADEVEFAMPESQVLVPPDQLKLTAQQLDEEMTRVLTVADPNSASNTVAYSYKEREFKTIPPGPLDNIVFHFSMDGSSLHVESDEAKAQSEWEYLKRRELEEKRREAKAADPTDDDGAGDPSGGKNQFNYSERAAQTYNAVMKDRVVSTEPPEVQRFGMTMTQWDLYDSYMAEYERVQHEAELEKGLLKTTDMAKKKDSDVVHSAAMGKALKIMERMVNQNAEDEIYNDFKFWEDASDQFRDGEGSLLPLWRFADNKTRRKQVTALVWNPKYSDLFAVGYGTYDFMKQGSGMICVYTLKNASHPEFSFTTESGVMCLDFHPQHPALLAVGCYDGTVKVFDVRKKENVHIFMSDIRTGKHTDPVWQVRWQAEDVASDMSFFSVSSDGRVASWSLSKNELKMEPVMTLKLTSGSKDVPDEESSLTGLAGGCCFDFNPSSEHLFVVGTEEGRIHKCSKAYSGQYLMTYTGHHMAVYSLKWNPYHPRVFLSCSADWTVKIWDHNIPVPVMTFDLANAIGDIAWAPYSSTVFAAATSDGKVHVYDLHVNKHEQLCEQKVVKRARLTHVVFNPSSPILIVGDDRGGVNSLKLSPNLRKITPIPVREVVKGEAPVPPPTRAEVEIAKMDKLLAAADTASHSEGAPAAGAGAAAGTVAGAGAGAGAGAVTASA